MKGLKVIPMFAALLLFSYVGVMFVRNNPDEVIVRFGGVESPSAALGFVILTSILVGMVASGLMCSVEMLVLYMQNQKLKRMINPTEPLINDNDSLEALLEDEESDEDEEEITELDSEEIGEERRNEKPGSETPKIETLASSNEV